MRPGEVKAPEPRPEAAHHGDLASKPAPTRSDDVAVRRRVLNRSLPGPIIDLIRDGVPANVLRAGGGRGVYTSLWRTAASACQRGLDQWEWEEYVFQPQSQLGRQVSMRDGRTALPANRLRKMLDRVWDQATAWASEQEPPASRQELLLRARPALTAARRKMEDPDVGLRPADRLVLAHACSEIEQRGMERVALPWRSVCEATGLGERVVKNSLRRLVSGRHLLLATAGKPGAVSKRRANVYRLPDLPVPEDGSMGPPAQFYGTPSLTVAGTPSTAATESRSPVTEGAS